MIKNVIFDWSGVIKDCVLDYLVIANKIFKEYGAREVSLKELQEEWSQPFMIFYNKYLPNITLEQEQISYRRAISESPKAKQYIGISDLIKEFKKENKKLIVLTSDDPETVLPEIKSFNLEGIFDEIIFGGHDKEEAAQKIIETNNFHREDTVFIGDSNHEIEIGKKIGIKTIAVTWGFSSENKLKSANPDFVVHDLKELKEVIM